MYRMLDFPDSGRYYKNGSFNSKMLHVRIDGEPGIHALYPPQEDDIVLGVRLQKKIERGDAF